MEDLLWWRTSSMPGPPPRQHQHERRYTSFTHPFMLTMRIWMDGYDGQMLFGELLGLKLPDICPYRRGETPKNLTQGTCPDAIEPGLAAWQARILPPAPQRWTFNIHLDYITAWGRYYELSYMFLNSLDVMSVNKIIINKALKGIYRIFRCIGRIFLT